MEIILFPFFFFLVILTYNVSILIGEIEIKCQYKARSHCQQLAFWGELLFQEELKKTKNSSTHSFFTKLKKKKEKKATQRSFNNKYSLLTLFSYSINIKIKLGRDIFRQNLYSNKKKNALILIKT